MNKEERKNTILNCAYELYCNKGYHEVTIQQIAENAGVNIAAINYYFGSKDNLVDLVVDRFVAESLDITSILNDNSLPMKERIKKFLIKYMDLCSYNYQKNIVFQKICAEDVDEKFVKSFLVHAELGRKLVKEITGINDVEKVNIKMVQFFSQLFFPMIILHYTSRTTGLDFFDPVIREHYIDDLVNGIFE